MKCRSMVAALAALMMSLVALNAAPIMQGDQTKKKVKYAVSLYDKGIYDRAQAILTSLDPSQKDWYSEGYALLCSVRLGQYSCEDEIGDYVREYPYSGLIPQIYYLHALNLFDKGRFDQAGSYFDMVPRKSLHRGQVDEFLFKRAYCDYQAKSYKRAESRFREVISRGSQDYAAPSQYALGYLCYVDKNFIDAQTWFQQSRKDSRFKEISEYYILECRFMQGDTKYVVENGPKMLQDAPQSRRSKLARLISESFLVQGDAAQARKYYDINSGSDQEKTRSDYFYSGSVLYSTGDWAAAAQNFEKMEDRSDSLGQIANYHLGYCRIQTRDKVAAMKCFKEAAAVEYNLEIQEDAFYNYAKLAFDLNGDMSGFNSYIAKYSDRKRGDRIYEYVAVNALRKNDYASAVEAFDKIDELDADMTSNYMKANYLRARQLIGQGSWRSAIPCLKATAWYAPRNGGLNELSRYWLSEAYLRDGQYDDAISILKDLYNGSALDGKPEGAMIPYSLGYCYYQKDKYGEAINWFDKYLDLQAPQFEADAYARVGDCNFMQKKYAVAARNYESAYGLTGLSDLYPYYQAGLCYGLLGKNEDKVKVLLPVQGADPSLAYYPEAMYELGRTYVSLKKTDSAKECFGKLCENARDTSYRAMALIELGTLARTCGDADGALSYYKEVVGLMPVSEYAENALAAIESIYQSRNDPDGYLAYIAGIGKSESKTEQEKDQMIFNAASQVYMSGNYAKAITMMQDYLDRYPEGLSKAQAKFYIGDSYQALGDLEKARDLFAEVLECGSGSFLEAACLNYSRLSYSLEKFDDAYFGYSSLLEIAQFEENRHSAVVGMMKAAYSGKRYEEAIEAAKKLSDDAKTTSKEADDAKYLTASSLMSLSQRDEALELFAELAERPTTLYGSEAVYVLILDCYERGDFEQVEQRVYAFADAGTPYQYWLAKSFIVLGDSFADQGDFRQAKATFESILEGYEPNGVDDVRENLEFRIKKLEEML